MSQQKLLKIRRPLEEVIEKKEERLSLKEGNKNRRTRRKYKQETRK